jgi:hypothetical protein
VPVIRAVVWKEVREQGLIAVMLAVLGGGLLVAAAAFADPPSKSAPVTDVFASLGAGRLLVLMLVVTAGMVCGGALFAAEREAGTMSFLDTLPTHRWALWRAKIAAGIVLGAAVVSVLLGAAALLDLGDGPFLRRLVVYALLARSVPHWPAPHWARSESRSRPRRWRRSCSCFPSFCSCRARVPAGCARSAGPCLKC